MEAFAEVLRGRGKGGVTELAEVTSRASLRMLGFVSGRYERLDGLRAVAIRRWSGLLATKVARARPMPDEQPVTIETGSD